jgi:DNA repair photolyase
METRIEWEDAPPARLSVYEDHGKTILTKNTSPDVPFTWSVNPYRGCFHGCTYCYARPSHEYLGFGAGTDFERKIVIKSRAAPMLEAAFLRPGWKGERICFSGNTDCYQPLEQKLGLTRACLEVCLRYRNPVGVITKSTIIRRDIELLAEIHAVAGACVVISVPFMDRDHAKAIEPNAPPPKMRLATIGALADAGIPVGVSISPVIPGLNDVDIPSILKAAHEAGARWSGMIPVRLPGPVESIFVDGLRATLPERADGVLNRIRRMRNGQLTESAFGQRMRGHGAEWAATVRLYQLTRDRLGMTRAPQRRHPSPFRVPGRGTQQGLFE